MFCTCTNPKCPKARQFNACNHCMCLQEPDFGGSQTIGYAGPIYSKCCKCMYRRLVSGIEYSTAV